MSYRQNIYYFYCKYHLHFIPVCNRRLAHFIVNKYPFDILLSREWNIILRGTTCSIVFFDSVNNRRFSANNLSVTLCKTLAFRHRLETVLTPYINYCWNCLVVENTNDVDVIFLWNKNVEKSFCTSSQMNSTHSCAIIILHNLSDCYWHNICHFYN